MKSIVIPRNVNYIDEGVFAGCSSLTEISIPEAVTSIEYATFAECISLKRITMPKKLTKIGGCAFWGCKSIANLEVPQTVKIIEAEAFCECSNLLSFVIPNGVSSIDSLTFENCTRMQSITVPQSIENIGKRAFYQCSNLNSITIPEKVTVVEDSVFYGCEKLKDIRFSNNIATIGKRAFQGCKSLKYLLLPESLKIIADFAFVGSENIKYIVIPDGVVSIGKNALFTQGEALVIRTKMQNPCEITNTVTVHQAECMLVVPKGSKKEFAKVDGWNNFKYIAEEDTLRWYTNGNEIVFTPQYDNATIYYTIDGTEPTLESSCVSGTLSIDASLNVNAFAVDNKSEYFAYFRGLPTNYRAVYDGETATVNIAGFLQTAFTEEQALAIKELNVVGFINSKDITFIKSLPSLEFLNLERATIVDNTLPDNAFAQTKLIVCHLPEGISTVGQKLFENCNQLAAIIWNSNVIPAGTLKGIDNPNLLLYVKNEGDAANVKKDGIQNIIFNGNSRNITLSDAVGNNNFFCPKSFVAEKISYMHYYHLSTPPNTCAGWETLSLPFNVQRIWHETKGEILPFGAEDSSKPQFWLYAFGENGFVKDSSIKSYQPFLISMPNDGSFSDEYNLAGNVSFSAENVEIKVTQPVICSKGNIQFISCFQTKGMSNDIFTINKETEGSMFVRHSRDVRPFEAYATNNSLYAPKFLTIADMDGETIGIMDIPLARTSNNVFRAYTINGQLVKVMSTEEELKQLPKGVYIVNVKKVVVR